MNKTNEIKLSCPYNNPYQGEYFKALFVCSAGLLRSATAANLFAKKGGIQEIVVRIVTL
jgi:hypothetical protein